MARLYNGMTEEEILAAGKTFCLGTPEVAARRIGVKKTLDAINDGDWENPEDRVAYMRTVFGALGENPFILEPISYVAGRNLYLGDNVFINSNVTFIDVAPITIGDHAMIAPGCVLTTVDHPKSPKARRNFTSFAAPITIGRDVWIGANCTVFPGVTIGNNVIIGANSVVNHDIPDNSVVAGAPARLIRTIEDDTE
ncbi:MAG: sugar O-acetyltransferase [Eggerthellaceae bacterium]|nr:sugar O-acetyltransferase [Eggerthellaceae bacterium]